ncbi:ribose-phosphate diphosphokinase [Halegenticoccus tardaugens]|uniref:ribose-phosphate diphosphokinase n=1 Tax=Halegenticoccus tardaugens TaxID=2071624 RepID=UPI00100B1B94|nr:ribose-phosphate diphosphokinase [Halegenticoccus tardaugens]
MILPGSSSQALAAALADALDEPLAVPEFRRFPDGELLVSAPALVGEGDAAGRAGSTGTDADAAGVDVDGGRAVVVASTLTSDAHVELLQLQDAAREAGADEVVAVVPYMGYARQDKAFKPGQPISARAVARAIGAEADRAVLVNPHEPSIADFFDVPCEAVDAGGTLAEPLPGDLSEPLFLSPDAGAIDLAETVRGAYGRGDADYFEKSRDYDTGEVEISPSGAPVEGRDVVLVDDIVATGSTMSEAVAVLGERDAARVFVACVHPLLASNARTKLEAAGVEAIYGTDTIERDVSAVSVADDVAAAL